MRVRFSCLIVCLGFVGCEARQPVADAEILSEDIVAKAMPLDEALNVFSNYNLVVEEITTASVWPNPQEEMREFYVVPSFESDDVLCLVAVSKRGKDTFHVQELLWHIDWKPDSKRPKTKRANRQLELDQINVRVLADTENSSALGPPTETDPDPFDEQP